MASKRFTLLILSIFVFSSCYSQRAGSSLSGIVLDSAAHTALEFVSVSLGLRDSGRILRATATDSGGRFTLPDIPAGRYTLTYSFIGFDKKSMPVEIIAGKNETLPAPVLMHASGKQLAEAEVLSEKPVIKFEPGKIVFDVAKTLTDGAETAMESMQKIPGVTVTQDGSVEVKGKGGVKYLVDGKPSPMAQSNPEAFLKSIPAKNIESIEINTNPSAKYDASGTAAVINIHLKKGKMEGLNGSVSAGVGTVFDKYNGSGNINYKKGKVNVFGNAYIRDEHSENTTINNRRVTVNDSSAYYNSRGGGTGHSTSASSKAGIEYSIDRHQSVTYALDMDYWHSTDVGRAVMLVSDNLTPALNQRISTNSGSYQDLNVTNSLNYRMTFDSSDRAWTIDIAHTIQKQDAHDLNISLSYDSLKNELTALDFYNRTRNYGTNHNFLVQTDFNTPLKMKGSKIETGFKEELNLHNTTNEVYSNMANTEIMDTTQSNVFKYTESITAAYCTYSGKLKKFSYSGGLRWEQTYIRSDNNAVNQNYADLFPSANVGWKFNDNNSLNLSYSRRINRPGFWMLNNATTYTPYSVSSGNPELRAAYTNSTELGYNAQIKEQSLNFDVSYSHEDGSFQYINHTLADRITFSHYENAGTQDNFFTSLNFSYKVTKWWNGSIYSGYGYHWFAYTQDGSQIKSEGGSLSVSGNVNFKFWKTASLQIWGWGSTGWVSAQSRYQPVGNVSASLKKKFFKDKLTVALSCRDIFHTMLWRSTVSTQALNVYNDYSSSSRIGYLTLTYQFGKQTFAPETKGKSDRMGGGGGQGGN